MPIEKLELAVVGEEWLRVVDLKVSPPDVKDSQTNDYTVRDEGRTSSRTDRKS